jgi:hypothetical protein
MKPDKNKHQFRKQKKIKKNLSPRKRREKYGSLKVFGFSMPLFHHGNESTG